MGTPLRRDWALSLSSEPPGLPDHSTAPTGPGHHVGSRVMSLRATKAATGPSLLFPKLSLRGVWVSGRGTLHTPPSVSRAPDCLRCLSQITLNDRAIHVRHDFTRGVNVDNAAHPCVAGPCAHGGSCRPREEGYECDCPLGFGGLHCQQGTRAGAGPGRGGDCWDSRPASPVIFISDFSDIVDG